MRGACAGRDADLLMLAHGEMEPAKALRLRAHLAVCPGCRARLRRLDDLSSSLASALRNPRLGVRTFARPVGAAWASGGLLLALMGGAAWFAAHGVVAPEPPVAAVVGSSSLACATRQEAKPAKPKASPKVPLGDEWVEDAAGRPHLVPKRSDVRGKR